MWVLTDDSNYQAIGDAIRAKNGTSDRYFPSQMGSAIRNISTASVSTVEQAIPNIAFNGTTVIATAQQQEGYVLSGTKSSIAYIPSEYIIPSGTLDISENGTYDIKSYASTNVYISNTGQAFNDVQTWEAIATRSISGSAYGSISYIKDYAFYRYFSLTNANFPKVTSIGSSAFAFCSNLTNINFPEAIVISSNAFYSCSLLTNISFPKATTLWDYAFYNCWSLTNVDFPKAKYILLNTFGYCYSLASINFPEATTIGSYAFNNCTSLTSIDFPKVTGIGSSAFYNCELLVNVNFSKVNYIESNAFQYCSSLKSVFLNNVSKVPSLYSINAFNNTPISNSTYLGEFGSIFVPSSLYESFITAKNWSYYSNRIVSV